jgi:hypothetical protein
MYEGSVLELPGCIPQLTIKRLFWDQIFHEITTNLVLKNWGIGEFDR